MSTYAVFGGSFDPPHQSHVMVAARVLDEVDGMMVVPAFKHVLDKRASAPFEDRVRMCEIAFAGLRGVEVSRVEAEIGDSRTLGVLEELARRFPERKWRFVMGADLLTETDRWHRFDRISELAPPLIVGRVGYEGPAAEVPGYSSSTIREQLREGEPVDDIPPGVADYIAEHGLYRA